MSVVLHSFCTGYICCPKILFFSLWLCPCGVCFFFCKMYYDTHLDWNKSTSWLLISAFSPQSTNGSVKKTNSYIFYAEILRNQSWQPAVVELKVVEVNLYTGRFLYFLDTKGESIKKKIKKSHFSFSWYISYQKFLNTCYPRIFISVPL